jgi:hypothetical protein
MTFSPCRVDGLGGGVTGSGGIDRPLIRGMTTDVSAVGRLFVMWMWRSVPWDGRAGTTGGGT